jgi:hypothetical protein
MSILINSNMRGQRAADGHSCANMKTGPIFLHSLWRAGSTYMFNAFRRASGLYTCYQESIHEIALQALDDPEILLAVTDLGQLKRHPKLDRPYFQELYDAYPNWARSIQKKLIYDQYFDKTGSPELAQYLESLIAVSQARPVFQECRTSGRIQATKNVLGGYHIYLLRNPHDQWWSILKDKYFSNALLMILNSEMSPKELNKISKEISFIKFRSDSIFDEFDFFDKLQYRLDIQYKIYFAVWILAYKEAWENADYILDMQALSSHKTYQSHSIVSWQSNAAISGIDLSDCAIPMRRFDQAELAFFHEIEADVLDRIFIAARYEPWMEALRTLLAKFHQSSAPEAEVSELRQIVSHVATTAAVRVDRRQHELGGRIELLEDEVSSVRSDRDRLEGDNSGLKSDNKKLSDRLAYSRMRQLRLRADLSATRSALDHALSARDDANALAASRSETIIELNQFLATARAAAADLSRNFDALVAEKSRQIDVLQTRIAKTDQQMQILQADLERRAFLISRLESAISHIYGTIYGNIGRKIGFLPNFMDNSEFKNLPPLPPSTEALDTELPNELDFAPDFPGERMSDITHINQLMMLNGSAFVDQAYRVFLKRSADRSGREHFLSRLQAGDGKEAIIQAIANSPEARTMRSAVAGMDEFQARLKKNKRLGGRASAEMERLERLINRIEHSLGQAQDKVLDRIAQIETSLDTMQSAMANVSVNSASPHQLSERSAGGIEFKASIKRDFSIPDIASPSSFIDQLKEQVRESAEATAFYGPGQSRAISPKDECK